MNTLPIGLIGDIGGGEILLIAAAILMLFGGERLPSIARTIGKTVEGLRKASQDFKDQLLKADEPPLENPFKPTQGTTFDIKARSTHPAIHPELKESQDRTAVPPPESAADPSSPHPPSQGDPTP